MKVFKCTLVLLAVSLSCGLFADSWVANGPKRKIETLVIVGNYKSSRLMADVIQDECRQPYILLPAKEGKSQKIIFFPAKNVGREIKPEEFNRFVRFLNPARIVIFGDERYVQEKYVKMLDRAIPIVRMEGEWDRVAEQATWLLNLSHLGSNYKRLRAEMLGDHRYKPTANPARIEKAAPQKSESAASDAEETAAPAGDVVELIEVETVIVEPEAAE